MVEAGRGRLDHQHRLDVGPRAPLARLHLLGDEGRGAQPLEEPGARVGAPPGARQHACPRLLSRPSRTGRSSRPERVASIMGAHADGPLRRGGASSSGAALLLASERAGSFITGSELVVDGGYNAMSIWRRRDEAHQPLPARERAAHARNPCISPDFCLDWPALRAKLAKGPPRGGLLPSQVALRDGRGGMDARRGPRHRGLRLEAPARGIPRRGRRACAGRGDGRGRMVLSGDLGEPAAAEEPRAGHDPRSTIFPTAEGTLGRGTLGVGARFTTLHWPAVEWAMSALELGVTANQNSIPRELVYDVGRDAGGAPRHGAVPLHRDERA